MNGQYGDVFNQLALVTYLEQDRAERADTTPRPARTVPTESLRRIGMRLAISSRRVWARLGAA